MKFNNLLLLLLFLVIPVFITCNEVDNVISQETTPSDNTTNIASKENIFGFSFSGTQNTYNHETELHFSIDSVTIGIAVSNYNSGNAKLELRDINKALIYSKEVNSNTAFSEDKKLSAIPVYAIVSLNNLSGVISIGVVKVTEQ